MSEFEKLQAEYQAIESELCQKYQTTPNFLCDVKGMEKEDSERLGKAINALLNCEEEEESQNQKKDYELTQDLFSKAKEEYSTTNNFGEAGYILPDGSLLKFGEGGIRGEDHRNIRCVYHELNIDLGEDRTDYMLDFIIRGAIRYMPECNGFTLCRFPTKEQMQIIGSIVRYGQGEAMLDLIDENGKDIASAEYKNVTPQKFKMEVVRYFEDGIKPQGNVFYEGKKGIEILITESQAKKLLEML